MSDEPRLVRTGVADYLRALALAVEKEQVLELELKWDGGSEVGAKVRLAKPVHFIGITIDLDVEDPA